MKKVRTCLMVFGVLCSMAFSTVVLAVSVGGGEWDYGVGVRCGYSDYYHGSRKHSATVKRGSERNQAIAYGGSWAKAIIWSFPPTRMEFFWNNDVK